MFRNLPARLFAAALLLPLIAFATATDGHWLRCRITGAMVVEASDVCCCGAEAAAPATPPATTVSEADCCDRVESHVSPTVAEPTVVRTAAPDAASFALALVDGLDVSIELVSAPPLARGPARTSLGPPTTRLRLIAKSTLLI
jgi:hypothetical protein